jgi:hypothetical protein
MSELTTRSVGTYLAARGFRAARGLQPGFDTSLAAEPGRVIVQYSLGLPGAAQTPQERREAMAAVMDRMEAELSRKYRVTLVEPAEGWGGFYLRVSRHPLADLTGRMREALERIGAGGVVYQYRPLNPSATRFKLATPRDLTPEFSGGLHAGSVMALERRGLVRLIPVTPEHGRAVLVAQDAEGER